MSRLTDWWTPERVRAFNNSGEAEARRIVAMITTEDARNTRLDRALQLLVRVGRAQYRESAMLQWDIARLTVLMRRAERVKRIVRAMVSL